MKRKNLLALLCAAVLMAASAACNAGSGDTARLAASAPAASGQPVSSQEAGSRPAETGSPAQAADTAAETGLSSPPAAADSQASRPADSRDTGHTPQPTAAREETEEQNVSEKPSEQNETLPSSQNGSAADIQSVEQSSETVTCEVGTPSLDLDAWIADANAHGDLIFTSSWGSVAAVPEKREYPVGTPSIQATIAVNIPGGYSLHSQDDAYTLQKR